MTLRKQTLLLFVHVTATPPNLDIGAAEIDKMHRARGFAQIGYHGILRRNGEYEPGRADGDIGAHVEGFNSISWGCSMVGGVNHSGKPENNTTQAQMTLLENILRQKVLQYPGAKILGHRDASPDKDHDGIIEPSEYIKECPCFDVIPWARALGLPVADIKGKWDDPKTVKPVGPDARNVYLQRLLYRAGFQFGAIDGDIGPKTRQAVALYQQFAGLKETGEFDEPTVARLRSTFETKKAA